MLCANLIVGKVNLTSVLGLTSGVHFTVYVMLDVKKANRFLENYLVLAGMVCSSVTCGPSDSSMQFDALNVDCWLAIASYLKLTDVLSCLQ